MRSKKNSWKADYEKRIKRVGLEKKRPIRDYKKAWEENQIEKDDYDEDSYYDLEEVGKNNPRPY